MTRLRAEAPRAKALNSYVRTQEIGAVIGNILFNPFFSWLTNLQMKDLTLWGAHSIVLDTALTAILMPLLVTLFTSSALRRNLEAGHLTVPAERSRESRLLSHLPGGDWALGLTIGALAAIILIPLAIGLFRLSGASEISFLAYVVIKAAYTGFVAFHIARIVILRQLLLRVDRHTNE